MKSTKQNSLFLRVQKDCSQSSVPKKPFMIFFGLIILIVLGITNAANVFAGTVFDVTKGIDKTFLCPRETGLFTDVVKNTDSKTREFTVTTKGSAAEWTTSVPNGFVLSPGESKTIYSYITPVQDSIPSNYDLGLTINSQGENQDVMHQVSVKKCYGSTLVSNQFIQRTCPAEVVKYEVSLTNNGEYKESFILTVEGQIKDKVTLSDKIVTLEKAESKKIYAYVNSPKEDGSYAFNIKSIGQIGKQLDSFNAVLNVDPCYAFDVAIAGNNSYSMCERSLLNIPIKVENRGTVANTFNIKVDGPQWAKFDKNEITLNSGEKNYVTLMIAPSYGVNGDFRANIRIVPQKGELKAATDFNFNIRKCHSVSALFLEQNISVCNGLQRTFDAIITNDGEVSKQYSFNFEGPNWVESNFKPSSLISLDPGKQQRITFTARPGETANESINIVSLKVNAIDNSKDKVFSTVYTSIFNLLPAVCYKPSISTQFDAVTVYYDSSLTLPLSIKNEGLSKVIYDIILSGTASNFVKLAPAVLSVDSGKSEISYLYIAPTPHLPLGQYDAIISLKIKDGSFLLTRRIPITVTDDKSKATSLGIVDKNLPTITLADNGQVSRWQRFKNWAITKWNSVFAKKEKPVDDIANIEDSVNPQVDKEVDEVSNDVKALGNEKDLSVNEVSNSEENGSVSLETQKQASTIKGKLLQYKFQILVGLAVLLFLIILIRLDVFGRISRWLDEE